MNYPVFLPVKKTVTTDIASYYVEVLVDTEENGVKVSIYEEDKSKFFFVRYRKLLVSRWFPLHSGSSADHYIAELLREYEKPFRLIRRFEEWNGKLDLSKEPDAKEEVPQQVINKVSINGKDIVGAFFDNLTKLAKPAANKQDDIPVYDWLDSVPDNSGNE